MTVATEPMSSLNVVRTNMTRAPRSFTVYLIRHGEAIHNVEEKAAKRRVLREQSERGFDTDHPETKKLAEAARKQVLLDPQFFDASITQLGRDEAQGARERLQECVRNQGLPAPQQVVVSPLQRCLSTVEEIFGEPEDGVSIRVEEDLRERLTGRPADNRMNSECLEERFPKFDFQRLRSLSSSNLLSASMTETDVSSDISQASFLSGDDHSDLSSRNVSFDMSGLPSGSGHNNNISSPPSPQQLQRRSTCSSLRSSASTMNVDVEIEDDNAVRKRAARFFLEMLQESQNDSLAIVTHKGFLRALERGCFGIAGSPEFKNCEVRVYKIDMTPGNHFLDGIERLS